MPQRYDPFNHIHKALRRALSQHLVAAACADGTWRELEAVVNRWRVLEAMLDEHHTLEDAYLGPELARIAPELHGRMQRDHAALDGEVRVLSLLAREIEAVRAEEAVLPELAQAYSRRLGSFIAAYFAHLADEESAYLAALHAALSDSELAALHGRMIASLDPASKAASAAEMLPALNPSERAHILAQARLQAAPAFEALCDIARGALEPAAWSQLQERLGIRAGC